MGSQIQSLVIDGLLIILFVCIYVSGEGVHKHTNTWKSAITFPDTSKCLVYCSLAFFVKQMHVALFDHGGWSIIYFPIICVEERKARFFSRVCTWCLLMLRQHRCHRPRLPGRCLPSAPWLPDAGAPSAGHMDSERDVCCPQWALLAFHFVSLPSALTHHSDACFSAS